MKIVFISSSAYYNRVRPYGYGGTDSQEYGISKELVRKGHQVYIVGNFSLEQLSECISKGSEINFINIPSPYLFDNFTGDLASALVLSKKIAKAVRGIKPDAIIINSRLTGYFPSKLDIPKVFVTHHPDAFDFYRDFAVKSNKLNYFMYPIKKTIEYDVMKHSSVIIALNNYIHDQVTCMGFEDVRVIPNGISVNKYFSGVEKHYILYAGGFRKVKGIEQLIEAYSLLNGDHGYQLVLIGSGKEERRLKKLVADKKIDKNVIFMPFSKKKVLRKYLSECAVFVLPSLFETFGIVLIEAMASYRPVIASDIPGPQNIISNGFDGLLFEKGCVEDLLMNLEKCVSSESLRNRLGRNARSTAESYYDFTILAQEYEKVIEELICR